MAAKDNNSNDIVAAKTERGFWYAKRESAGKLPEGLAGRTWTTQEMANRAIEVYHLRNQTEQETTEKE